MTTLSRAQIAASTGLPATTLTRHLQRFAAAKLGRDRYDSSNPQLAAWLAHQAVNGGHGRKGPPAPTRRGASTRTLGQVVKLPSGWIVSARQWEALRAPDEAAALATLDRMIGAHRFTPHRQVPDLLPFEALSLESGTVVNATQWHVLRQAAEGPALAALDVLIRRWGCRHG